MTIRNTCTAAFLAIIVTSGALVAQDKPTVTPDDYDQWERLGAAVLSPDGAWMAVSVGRVNDEDELRIHSTTSDSVVIVPFGSRPSFSSDNQWVAYAIGMSEDDSEAAEERDEQAYSKLGLLNLGSGVQTERDDFESFTYSDDGRFLALQRYKPEDKESDGVDVVVHDLSSGSDMSFGNISEMAWQDDGTLLALATDADDRVGNGITLYDPASGERSRSTSSSR